MDFMGSLEKGAGDLAGEKALSAPLDSISRIVGALQKSGRAFGRGKRFARHLDRGLRVVGPGLGALSQGERSRTVQEYLEDLLDLLEISAVVHEPFPCLSTPCLLVSNHLSWLDPIVLGRFIPVRFVSKSEVGGWPFLGALAGHAGAIMIERGRPGSVFRTIDRMERILSEGESVGWFPEGTTGNGEEPGCFSSGLFEVAVRTGFPVLPVALGYPDPEGFRPHDSALYYGRRSFVGSLARILYAAPFPVILRAGPLIHPSGLTRQELAQSAREEVLKLLSRMASSPA